MKNIGVLIVVSTLSVSLASCSLLKPAASKSIAALRKVQAATKTGVSRDRYLSLVADSRLAVEDDCPIDTKEDPCRTLRVVQKLYEMDGATWSRGYSDALESTWASTSNILDKVK